MALKKRGGLGSGMSSLFSSNEIEEKHSGGVLEVDINKITPNPKPVSYTHLDVYKRQLQLLRNSLVVLSYHSLWTRITLLVN